MNKEAVKLLEAIGETWVEFTQTNLKLIGLENSDLYKSLGYKVIDYSIELYIADYWKYVEAGRRAGVRKVPINALLKWMKKKRIAAGRENKIVWAIQQSIFKRGIKPRPFLKKSLDETQKEVEAILAIDFFEVINKNNELF